MIFRSHQIKFLVCASVFAAVFATASCSTPSRQQSPPVTYVKKIPAKPPNKTELEIHAAESAAQSGDKKAIARLRKIAQNHVEAGGATAEAIEATLALGKVSYRSGQFADALARANVVLHSDLSNDRSGTLEIDACLLAASSLLRLNRAADSEAVLDRAYKHSPQTQEQAIEILRARVQAFSAEKKNVDALQAAALLLERNEQKVGEKSAARTDAGSTEIRDKDFADAQEFIESRLNEDELHTAADDSSLGKLQNIARYRYALLLADQKQYGRARDYFTYVIDSSPDSDLAERARAFVQQIDSRNRVDAKTIGVILPLSGKQAAIGYRALHGLQMGLGIYGNPASHLRLAVMDSEGNPNSAQRAVERLVQEDNVIGIVGGLLSKTAGVEATKAEEFGVPIIMLSQKNGITQAGESVFRNAFTSQMQMKKLVETAMGPMNCRRFAIIFPNDAYGTEYANLFWDEVRSRGGDVVGAQPYDPKETDFHAVVQRLIGTFYVEDRMDEYKAALKQWEEKNPHASTRHAAPALEDILPPVVDFDAVFIPDSARAVGQIAPMLAYSNVTNFHLLGTNLWNSPNLVARAQKFVDGAVFVDSILSNDPNFKNSEFFTNYHGVFGEDPGLVEVQSYDSGVILRKLLQDGESTRIGLSRALAGVQNVTGGVMGPMTMSPEREVRRPMTVMTVKNGLIQNF